MDNFIGSNISITSALCVLLSCFVTAGAQPVTCWRGDGTGKYPAADPPLAWSRVSVAMKGLRFSAGKPESPDAAAPMPDGVIREWLIAGPLPFDPEKASRVVPEEAALDPQAGQELGRVRWKKVTTDTAYLDFMHLLGKPNDEDTAAFAFTHVYSPTGGKFRIDLTFAAKAQLWVNGRKPLAMGSRSTVELDKGWNRLLVRALPAEKDWYAAVVMHGQGRGDYEQSGIIWRTVLPDAMASFYGGGMGVGAPAIVGEHLYLVSEPHDLICLNKADGKVLWIRRASYFEAATDEEKTHPAYVDAMALAGKIDAIDASYVAGSATTDQFVEKWKLETALRKQMKLVDAKRYANQYIPDVGFSGFTPCTDGKFIYAWFGDGVSVCFDLAGNRRWMRIDQHDAPEHGFSSSPLLIDGKFVIFMRDLIAMECATGKVAWQIPITKPQGPNPDGYFHGALTASAIDGVNVILLGNGMIVRAADGAVVWKDKFVGKQFLVSPVVEKNQVFTVTRYNRDLSIRTLPEHFSDPLKLTGRAVLIDTSAFPKNFVDWELCSPVIHEGLAYLVNNAGVLTVVDIEAGTIVYQKMLDLDIFQASNEGAARGIGISPILAGKYLYFMGNSGTTLVIEPGRVYRQVAKNKIENVVMPGHWSERQERFVANPVPEGNRIYIRGEESIYAIGAR
jgi:outer membrane protein assembly factor BamB